MFLPDDLYHEGLNPRDLSGWPFNFYVDKQSSAQAAAQFSVSTALVPVDRALTVMCINATFQSGGAQTVGLVRLYISDGTVTHFLKDEFTPSNPTNHAINIIEELIIPPNWKIGAMGNFSAGALANTINLYVTGWLIPAGGLR